MIKIDEFAKDGYWPIVIFTAIIQFGLQIWGSVVVFGYGSNWQYNNKTLRLEGIKDGIQNKKLKNTNTSQHFDFFKTQKVDWN